MAVEQLGDNATFVKANVEIPSGFGAIIADKNIKVDSASSASEISEEEAKAEQENAEETVKEESVDNQSVEEVIKFLNSEMPLMNTSLVFEFDELNEPPIVKVVDKDNGETIREIPPKYLKDVSRSLQEAANNLSTAGALFDKKV